MNPQEQSSWRPSRFGNSWGSQPIERLEPKDEIGWLYRES